MNMILNVTINVQIILIILKMNIYVMILIQKDIIWKKQYTKNVISHVNIVMEKEMILIIIVLNVFLITHF